MGEFFVFSAFLWKYIEENWMRYFMWRFVKIDRLNLYGKVVIKFDMGARGRGNWEEEDWEVQNLARTKNTIKNLDSRFLRKKSSVRRSQKLHPEVVLSILRRARKSELAVSWAFFVFSGHLVARTSWFHWEWKESLTRRC